MNVVVHGGAGSEPDDPEPRRETVEDAADAAAAADGPLSAVCVAVRRLESDPRFNAGTGSAVQSDGRIRTDAGLMTGEGTVGAACAMTGVEHAVDVARVVAEETPHVLIAGDRAVDLAAAAGVATDRDLWTERTRERWAAADPPEGGVADQLPWVLERFGDGHDTVGAAATDGNRLAAATSTGGRWFALAGRVGDVPQVGAGFYADERGAASATGAGEAITRFGLARAAVARLDGERPEVAAASAVDAFADATGEGAGVVLVDADGRAGEAFNTAAMQTARR
ncbi:isoaspartyl peptidase/L-asparaginase [Halomicrobium salinisoli]|uniref:isoaspartyl peptidase/L-asparaginase n=1 Tax=Halomicrobium salinisoli TaxID=2878391 RepID=UPI001CEFD4C0|nr:isoaspartyl peptidase/L-asparaginase [Halomicrobium salinisoli]